MIQPITKELIEKIVINMATEGGYSIDLKTGVDNFETGYFVAIDDTEETHPVYKGTLIRTFIKQFIVKNWDLLDQSNKVLGLWIENGKIYADVSTLYETQTEALTIGRLAGQLAIFDNASKTAINLN